MALIKIIKSLAAIFGLACGLLIGSTTFFAAMNIRLAWFPPIYSAFLEQLGRDILLEVGWMMLILLYISLVRDSFGNTPRGIIDAEQLPSNLFYRITGDNIAERDGKIIASLEAFGNILGNGNKCNIIALIRKEKFPYFILNEKTEDKKIFPGTFLKITWLQNKTTNKT